MIMNTAAILFFSLFSLFTVQRQAGPEEICVTDDEHKLYDLIMEYRKSKGLGTIPLSPALTKVAQIHVKDLMENYNQTNKCNPHSWSRKGNWSSCCYTNDHKEAECMWNKPRELAGYTSPGYEIVAWRVPEATPQHSLEGWQKSKGHNPLLVNSGIWEKVTWGAIGIGMYKNYAAVWFGELKDNNPNLTFCK